MSIRPASYYGDDCFYRPNNRIPEVKPHPGYVVWNRIYRTKKGAASKVAWALILNKYGRLEEIQLVNGLECNCVGAISGECEIHARRGGYFKRLHDKMARIILKVWEAKEKASNE